MDEEGYGQRRICNYCQAETNPKNILEMKAEENWGGQTKRAKPNEKPKERTGRYLRDKFPINKLIENPILAEIPILKNGESKNLKAIKSKCGNIDLINTCAFDAYFQLFLAAAIDSQEFLQKIILPNTGKSLFCELLKRTTIKKIDHQSYKLRKDVLEEIFVKRGDGKTGCFVLDCQSRITEICKKLMNFTLIFMEKVKCENNCINTVINRSIIMISLNSLLAENFVEQAEKEIQLESSSCLKCEKQLIKSITANDNIVLFEVIDTKISRNIDSKINLSKIPERIKLSFMSKALILRGFINWKPPQCLSVPDRIGHYTAFYFRKNMWIEVDQIEAHRSVTTEVIPQILLYTI